MIATLDLLQILVPFPLSSATEQTTFLRSHKSLIAQCRGHQHSTSSTSAISAATVYRWVNYSKKTLNRDPSALNSIKKCSFLLTSNIIVLHIPLRVSKLHFEGDYSQHSCTKRTWEGTDRDSTQRSSNKALHHCRLEKIIEKRKETPSFLTFYIRIGGGLSLQLGEYIRSDMPDKKVLVVTIGLGTLLLLPILRRWTRQNSTQRHEGLPTSNTSCKKSGVRRRIPAFFM